MLTQQETLTFERTVKAEPSELFRAFTHKAALRDWLCNAADVEPRKGGRIYFSWSDGFHSSGVFTELERDEKLAFTWRGPSDPRPSEVSVAFAQGEEGTTVSLTHAGLGTGPEWAEAAERIKQVWQEGLENLEHLLATGIDLRFARRPMFGLSGGDMLNPELAERLGVPVKEGLWLGGVVEGMGAHAAGLQKDDVIVQLDGDDTPTFPAFLAVLQRHQAGDRIPVTFYRGPEKQTVEMELSRRPSPDLPGTGEALAERVRADYAAMDAEIEKALEGVTEEEAGYRPGPNEWCVREELAHLLAIEHDNQSWLASVMEDADEEQPFHTNLLPRLQAITSVYSTVPDLLDELKRNEAVTIAMIANLPPDVAKRRHMFNQFATWMTNFTDHSREHLAEIKRLVEEARK